MSTMCPNSCLVRAGTVPARISAPACCGRGRSRRRSRRSRPSGSRPWRPRARLCHHSSSRNSLVTPELHVIPRQRVHSPYSRVAASPIVVPVAANAAAPGGLRVDLGPRVEARAVAPCGLDHVGRDPRRRGRARPRAWRCGCRAARAGSGAWASRGAGSSCLAASWSRLDMPSHWKGVCGFGTKFEALTCTEKRPPRQHAPADLARPEPEVDDALHLGVRLARQADHEVHLEARVARRERRLDRVLDHLVGDRLADDVAHPLRRRLRRERDRALARVRGGGHRAPARCRPGWRAVTGAGRACAA